MIFVMCFYIVIAFASVLMALFSSKTGCSAGKTTTNWVSAILHSICSYILWANSGCFL